MALGSSEGDSNGNLSIWGMSEILAEMQDRPWVTPLAGETQPVSSSALARGWWQAQRGTR